MPPLPHESHRSSQCELRAQQDKWVEYPLATSRTLERAFKAKKSTCDVDTERFVNLDPQDLYQARKDSPDRRRMVRRGDDDQEDDDNDDDDDDTLDSVQEDDDSDGSDSGELELGSYPPMRCYHRHFMCIVVGAGGDTHVAGTTSSDDNAQVIKWFWGRPLPCRSF